MGLLVVLEISEYRPDGAGDGSASRFAARFESLSFLARWCRAFQTYNVAGRVGINQRHRALIQVYEKRDLPLLENFVVCVGCPLPSGQDLRTLSNRVVG